MVDWGQLFVPQVPALETFIRGTVTYFALFTMLRLLLKRESGTTGVTDLLVIVLIADAAQNAMSGQYTTITDGIFLVAVILGWSVVLDFIAYHVPAAARIIRPEPLLLVKDGRVLHKNLRRELISEAELHGLLREQGIDSLARVREARMESDGQISVTPRSGAQGNRKQRKQHF